MICRSESITLIGRRKLPKAKFVDCSGIVEAGRVIKSDYEIELMRKTARIKVRS